MALSLLYYSSKDMAASFPNSPLPAMSQDTGIQKANEVEISDPLN